MNDTIARIRYNPAIQLAVRLSAYAVTLVALTQALLCLVIMYHQTGQDGQHRWLNRILYGDPYPWYYLIDRQWSIWWTATWGTALWCGVWATFIICAVYNRLHRDTRRYRPSRIFMAVFAISGLIAAVGFIGLGGRGIIF